MLGLLNPITVLADSTLVAGLHRLEEVKSLGLADIDENLIRNELTILEQGEHIAERERLLGEKGLRAEGGTKQKNATNETSVTVSPLKTNQQIASDIGLSERSYQQRKQIASNISDAVKNEIRDTEMANSTSQLLELVRLPEVEQLKVVEAVKSGEAKNVKEASGRQRPKTTQSANTESASPFDHCQTSPYAVELLIKHLPDSIVWEPANADGYLSEALVDGGCKVVTS